MPDKQREVRPGPDPRSVRTQDGQVLRVPTGWVLVPPGDAALTRRLKAAGPTWTVKDKRGRRSFSQGLWTDGAAVQPIRDALTVERADPAHARKLDAGRRRREVAQVQYEGDFQAAILSFLAFHPSYALLARVVSNAITEHAAGVGSGTVARTKRIPIEQRAEAATIAWLRHQTTEYDDMDIPRVKGMRREVRAQLARRSRRLLDQYRQGKPVAPEDCPLSRAVTF